ncbi:MAG TPA: DNA ligase D [Bryobacteraceae bacterium]|nr:DNA ligase D [Bryobacteraceae bacterium]
MKAQLADSVPRGQDWLFEIKWDGVRAIAFIENESVRLQSRTGNRCERQYPELAVIPHQVAAETAILDGEIAVLDAKGVSQFHLIQPRIMNADPNSIAHMSRNTPVVYFVFDILYLDGWDLRGVRLEERRKLLEDVVTPDGVFRISAAFPGVGEEMLEAARENGLEGLLAKRASSCYEAKRSSDWLKIKIVTQQEFVVGGFTEPQGERAYFGALVLGVYEDGKLRWVGNTGTGFDQRTLAFMDAKLRPLATSKCPFAVKPKPDRGMTWVKPELVVEVKFGQWTPDKKLRAPVYLGLREDVKPTEATREVAAREEAAPAAARATERPTDGEFLGDVKEATCRVDGQTLKFTNLKKVYYPDDGVTKRDVLNYYDAVSGLILPHLRDRPLSLKRYPNGIKEQFFFQKHAAETFAPWLKTEMIDSEHNEAPINYVFAQDRAALLYLVNLGCIDHNPWMSRSGSLENPDFVLIDLDPQHCSFEKIVEAALLVKEVLDEIGMEGYPKTTGGDGMHVYIPVETDYTYDHTRAFAEVIARIAARRRPELFTTPRSVSKRERNRVYFDWMQNAKSKTIAAPYVLRAYPGAPVATPLEWDEVKPGLHPDQFNISNVRERFRERGDLFAGVIEKPQRIEKALGKLEKLYR